MPAMPRPRYEIHRQADGGCIDAAARVSYNVLVLGNAPEERVAAGDKSGGIAGPLAGYRPTRPSKLRDPGSEPPPIPAASSLEQDFGAKEEDGLRMLAALQTLTSLEPDYSDDLALEASVTIIDTSTNVVFDDPVAGNATDPRPLRHLIEEHPDPQLLLNGYETFLGHGDEAIVEIVEISHPLEEPETAPERSRSARPASLVERLATATGRGGRFFKALSGA